MSIARQSGKQQHFAEHADNTGEVGDQEVDSLLHPPFNLFHAVLQLADPPFVGLLAVHGCIMPARPPCMTALAAA